MVFHVDMIFVAIQAKRDFEKRLGFEMRIATKSNPGQDVFSFMSKQRNYGGV